MTEAKPIIYAGLSNVTYDGEPFELGQGVRVSAAYAHLFSAPMMAFTRAEAGKHHPAPWRAVRGGFAYDIEVEIAVPNSNELPGGLSAEDTVWLIAALLRLARHAYLIVPVLSDQAFAVAGISQQEALLRPFEIEPRIIEAVDRQPARVEVSELEWLKSIWPRTAELIRQNPSLNLALRAADASTVRGRPASALLTAWGALEELFAPPGAELRFRISAYIAAYLEPIGPKRLELFKNVALLYNTRSKVAHSAQNGDSATLIQSFIILRNALIQIINEGAVPTQENFEKLLFCT